MGHVGGGKGVGGGRGFGDGRGGEKAEMRLFDQIVRFKFQIDQGEQSIQLGSWAEPHYAAALNLPLGRSLSASSGTE